MERIKKYSATVLLLLFAFFANAEESKTAANNTGSSIDGDTMLVVCIGILALVIVSLGRTVLFTIKYYSQKEKEKQASNIVSAKPLLLLVLVLSSISAMAENVVATQVAANSSTEVSAFRMLLYIILLVELVVIFALQAMIKYFMKPELAKSTATTQVAAKNEYWKKLWDKMNQFKPIEYEASIDTGHSYDGIRELNNVTPPWFKVAFIASIIFAGAYLYRYHVAHSAPLPQEELAIAMEEANAEHEAFLKTQKNLVDENNVVMLNEDGVSAGATLFKSNCVACHGAAGQGGVGPNLTDAYWLHGGSVKDVFKSIKYGWKEKGMQSWESNFSPEQIAELASYVMSLKGSNPTNAKEPQGDLFKEVVTVDSSKKLALVDSVKK